MRGETTPSEPIFVDRSGRRRRLLTIVGAALAVLLTAAVALLVAGFLGSPGGHIPGLPTVGNHADRASAAPARSNRTAAPLPSMPVTETGSIAPAAAVPTSATPNNNGKAPTTRPSHVRPTKSR